MTIGNIKPSTQHSIPTQASFYNRHNKTIRCGTCCTCDERKPQHGRTE